jgi:hypothetical protein
MKAKETQMANGRIFSEAERSAMTRKPTRLAEIAEIALSHDRFDALVMGDKAPAHLPFSGGLAGLNAAIAAMRADSPDVIEVVAYDEKAEEFYLVNTEGYEYARYVARVTA